MESILGSYVRKIKNTTEKFNHNNETNKFISTSIVVGGIASFESFISQPVEKIRVFYQAKHQLNETPFTNGFRSLFRGSLFLASTSFPITAFSLGYYNYLNKKLNEKHSVAYSASVASIVSRSVTMPFYVFQDVINQKILHHNSSFRQEIINTYKTDGLKGFFKGFNISTVSTLIMSFSWWVSYESTIKYFKLENPNENPIKFFVIGALCNILCAILTNPFEIIRTQYQLHSNLSYKEIIKNIKPFNGLSIRIVYAIITGGIYAMGWNEILYLLEH